MVESGGRRRVIRSRLASARVVGSGDRASAIASSPITPGEAAWLASRHPQSLAGILAAKEATAGLLSDLAPDAPVRPADVVISHDPEGAPLVSSLPPGVDPRTRVLVSISHTAEIAWALAVVETVEEP